MSGLTWLHISDWHQEGKIFNAKVVCDELVKDIRNRTNIDPDLKRIDFIVFSGDVAQGGKAKQYDESFENFFKPILEAANLDPEFLFIVPDNHDQDRDAINPDLPKAMKSNDEVDSWWDEDEKRSKILRPFQAFNDFKRNHLGQTPTEYADTRLWIFDGKKIALLGINSAWMCSRRKDQSKRFIDQGNLCVGEPQFYEALKQISEADIKIAVLHHPLDWLIPFDRKRVGNRLKRNCRFILHGHGHEPGASANTDTIGYHIVIPAGACYDRRKPPGSNYVFSYNYVHLNFDNDEGTAFLRRWSEENRTWLKDYETCSPDGKFPFSIKGPEIPHQIPSPRADFTGRDDELKELLTHFEQGVIIAGIRGLGGIGKTELAYKLAQELKERYPDGQILVRLEGLSEKPLTPAEGMISIIHAYDRQAVLQDDDVELDKLYRQKLYGKRALLLLDNAFDDQQTRPLIPPPTCGLIITSRREFTLDKMRAINLEELRLEKAVDLLKTIVGTSRPQEVERCEERVWKEIAQLCGRLPLALLAAGSLLANTRDLSPAEYAKRLSNERTRLESIGSQGVPMNVKACLNLSYQRLSAETACVFRRLHVFPADFDAKAEEDICSDEGHRHLSELVKWSLADYQEDGKRYKLHDLVRIFAGIFLETTESEEAISEVRQRHAAHFQEILWEANKLLLKGGDYQPVGLELFDSEWMNIQVAQTWAENNIATSSEIAKICSNFAGTGSILKLRLHLRDNVSWLKAALVAARQIKERNAEAAHLGNLGLAYTNMGDVRKAIEYHEQALVIKRETGDRSAEGTILGNLGYTYDELGDTRKAIEYYEQALAIKREIGDRRAEGSWLGHLGRASADLGEARKAMEYNKQALAIAREIGDRLNEGKAFGGLGNDYVALGDAKKAREYYEKYLAIAREIRYRRDEGKALGCLGYAYDVLGDTRKAIEFSEKGLVIAREIGDRKSEGAFLFHLSLYLNKLGQRAEAIESARSALKIFEQIESPNAERARQQLDEWQK